MSRTKLLDEKMSDVQRVVAEYVDANASDVLVEKINQGKKSMADCWSYIFKVAKQEACGSKSLCVDDQTVYGWAMHYFEEDDIAVEKITFNPPVKTEVKEKKKVAAVPKAEHKKPKEENPAQMTIFDLMGGSQ